MLELVAKRVAINGRSEFQVVLVVGSVACRLLTRWQCRGHFWLSFVRFKERGIIGRVWFVPSGLLGVGKRGHALGMCLFLSTLMHFNCGLYGGEAEHLLLFKTVLPRTHASYHRVQFGLLVSDVLVEQFAREEASPSFLNKGGCLCGRILLLEEQRFLPPKKVAADSGVLLRKHYQTIAFTEISQCQYESTAFVTALLLPLPSLGLALSLRPHCVGLPLFSAEDVLNTELMLPASFKSCGAFGVGSNAFLDIVA